MSASLATSVSGVSTSGRRSFLDEASMGQRSSTRFALADWSALWHTRTMTLSALWPPARLLAAPIQTWRPAPQQLRTTLTVQGSEAVL